MTSSELTGYGPQPRMVFDGDESRYEIWETKMLAYMKSAKLKDVILPESTTIASAEQLDDAFSKLVPFLDDRSLRLVLRDAKDNGRKALGILREHYAGSGSQRILSLYTTLTSLQKQSSESLTDYILRAETAAAAVRSAKKTVDDDLLVAMVLKGLPSSFKPFTVVITQQEKVMSFKDFKVALRNYEENEKATGGGSSNDSILKVRFTPGGGGSRPPSNEYDYDSPPAPPKSGPTCYTCNKPGHKYTECPDQNGNNPKQFNKIKRWCSRCKSNTHNTINCRFLNNNKDTANRVSHEERENGGGERYSFIFGVREVEETVSNTETELLLVDSGASSHIINDESKFISFDESYKPEKHILELADGTICNSVPKKQGTAIVNLRDENNNVWPAKLEDALYLPSYPQSIFSVKRATKRKDDGTENDTVVTLRSETGDLLADGVRFPIHTEGNLYYLNKVTDSKQRTASLEEWHRILGHSNTADIQKLENIVDDMKITHKDKFQQCTNCILSKTTNSRNHEPDKRASQPLELVHSDLSGPVDPVALGGFQYAMNFVDDYSGAATVYLLKKKSDAVHALRKFLADSAPIGDVKKFRSDNGGEYVAEELEEVLLDERTRHEFSAPHSPHQNGTAERNWRTLFEMARGMLIESNLPKRMWGYAVLAAAHIRNRMYSQRTQTTAIHLLTGSQPSISKLHVFGSVCYPYVQIKKKLDPRCKKGIFVGYDKNSPAYLVYFPETNSVTRNHTVKFTDKYDKELSKLNEIPPENDFLNPNTDVDVQDGVNDDLIHGEDGADVRQADDIPAENQERRYPQRQRNRPKYLNDYACKIDSVYRVSLCQVDECYKVSAVPKTYSSAMKSSNDNSWKSAMDSEMKSLIENDTFSVVPLPKGKTVVGSRWVYSLKNDPAGNIVYKARFVARGYSQVAGVDYSDSFSPTAKMTTIRLLMQFAAEYGLTVHQLDVKTAYLNAPIDCEVYLTQPEGYSQVGERHNETLVWKLKKSLYGLKQSGRNWNAVLDSFFKENGFTQSEVDACLYKKGEENLTLIVVWVDDIVIAASTETLLNSTKDMLKHRFKMKDLGPISWFLGIQFKQTPSGITMNQTFYLKGVLERFQMSDCKPRSTPCEAKPDAYEDSSDDEEVIVEETRKYREIIGSLVYAMSCTRPDLAWVVTKLSQHLAKPSASDWVIVKHVLRYIKSTVEHTLYYSKSKNGLEIEGFSDSDWASSSDRRSTSGYYFRLNEDGGSVSWKSRKQPTVALSSCEAEYMALVAAAQESIFLRMLTKDFGLITTNPIRIHGDNQGSLSLVKNPVNHQKSKHIDIKYHFIREKQANGDIEVLYVKSADNVADLLTKPANKLKLDQFHQDLFGAYEQ